MRLDIRVSRKLTLNVGFRWDAPLFFHELKNRSGVFDLNQNQYVQFGTNGLRTTPWDNNLRNFGPRFGFAYSPFGDSRTVVRAPMACSRWASGRATGNPS